MIPKIVIFLIDFKITFSIFELMINDIIKHKIEDFKMASVLKLDASTFDAATSNGVALIDFWAEWCGPCKMLLPVLEDVAKEVDGAGIVAKVNVDEAQELAMRYNVISIPALFVLKDGEIVSQFTGVQDKATLVSAIQNA